MKVLSKHFGEIEIEEEHVVTFEKGLIGFEEYKRYVFIEFEKDSFVYWMQSIENTDLCFLVANPYVFKPDYILDVYEDDLRGIYAEKSEDLMVFVILNVNLEEQKVTANLLGPVIVNTKNNRGVQAVSKINDYPTDYDITSKVGVK
ncbi:MAG: flagellar assembly protein FliW [Brevinematia bacterium]